MKGKSLLKRSSISVLALLLVLSSVFSSLLSVTTANAVSDYDDYYTNQEVLMLTFDDGTNICSRNVSLDWATLIPSGLQSSFETALETGSWGVSNFPNFTSTANGVNIYWKEVGDMSTTWPAWGYIVVGGATHSITVEANSCDGTTIDGYATTDNGTSAYISSNDGAVINYLFTSPVTYPEGYEGPLVVDSAGSEPTIVRPAYKWDVNVKNIKITDITNIDAGLSMPPYKVKFLVTLGTIETQTYFYEFILDNNAEVIIDLPVADELGIQAWFVEPEGAILADTDDLDFKPTNTTFTIDGSSFSGSTEGTECDEEDHCTVPEVPRYSDCSVHNITISTWSGGPEFQIPTPTTIGCIVNNFWLKLVDFIYIVLGINPEDPNPFESFTSEQHGLTAVLFAPFTIFEGFTNESYTCAPLVLPLPYIGSDLTLPCMTEFYEETGGSMFTMYQTIVSGVISYFVLLGFLRIAKEAKDPQNDKIKAGDL